MLRAAKTGNIDAVKRELTGHTDVNSQDEVVCLSFIAFYCTLGGWIKGTARLGYQRPTSVCSHAIATQGDARNGIGLVNSSFLTPRSRNSYIILAFARSRRIRAALSCSEREPPPPRTGFVPGCCL